MSTEGFFQQSIIVTTQVFRLKVEVGFYDLGFKQRGVLVAQESQPLKIFSLST